MLDRPALLAGLVALLAGLTMIVGSSAAGGKDDGTTLRVKEGDRAPDVELPAVNIASALPDQKDAKTLKLAAFKGKKNVVLYFFPKALTAG
jgi:hypothetical protein